MEIAHNIERVLTTLLICLINANVSVILLLNLNSKVVQVSSEIFTSQSDLESLIYLRSEVRIAIDLYIEKETSRLEYLKERFQSSRGLSYKTDSKGSGDLLMDAGNPINAFLLVKALSLDLAEIVHLAGDHNNFREFVRRIEDLNELTQFPDTEDISGAALALIRLQDTYRLDTKSMAKGAIGSDHCCAPELSVEDCFELGKQSYHAKDFEYAIQWFTEALARLPPSSREAIDKPSNKNESLKLLLSNPSTHLMLDTHSNKNSYEHYSSKVSKSDILDYLSWAKDIKSTLELGKDFLAHATGLEFGSFVEEIARAVNGGGGDDADQRTTEDRYKSLCRGETRANSSVNPKLTCYYSSRGNNPFYLVGPVREELVNVDPPIWIFRDVLHDKEIETIKKLAKPRFETAMVVNVLTGTNEKSRTRVSKSAWLTDEDDLVVRKVNNRIGDITGLSMETAELLQVANYGIGGMYLPHYDFAQFGQTANFVTDGDGNRIATMLLYMSNVEKGGATVFPKLNLSVWPEKGSAVFWYNLKRSGEGDLRTQHAACPCLIGSKWVSNKWIHEAGQEFRYKCGLLVSE